MPTFSEKQLGRKEELAVSNYTLSEDSILTLA
jgi:hypothetical protein